MAKELRPTTTVTSYQAPKKNGKNPFKMQKPGTLAPQNLTCTYEVPGVTKKGDQLDAALKALNPGPPEPDLHL